MNIEELLHLMVKEGASDLHLRVPSPPVLRIDGALLPLTDLPRVTPQIVKEALEHITTEAQREKFYDEYELDFAYSVRGLARFRANAFYQRGTISIAIRQVPFQPPTIDELALPQI